MNNSDFNVENQIFKEKRELLLNKKTIIIIILILTVLVLLYLFVSGLGDEQYTLEMETPEAMYIDEPIAIPVQIKGPEKYLDEIVTASFATSDEIIDIPDNEFEGKSGKILIKPVSLGEEEITISSSIGADKYSKELINKTFHITVCPKFGDNLVTTKNIYIKKGEQKNLNIDFGAEACSKIITYDSQNTQIATVDVEGVITAVSLGQTKVVLSNGSNAILINVNVVNK